MVVDETVSNHKGEAVPLSEQPPAVPDNLALATCLGEIENLLRRLTSGRDIPPHLSNNPRRGLDTSSEGEGSLFRGAPPN